MGIPVAPERRFHSKRNPCPVCNGGDDLPRGQERRCMGFLSADGGWAHCSREEHAGPLPLENSGTYAHRLDGPCRCGATHGAAPPPSTPRPPRTVPEEHFRNCEAGSPWDYTDEAGALLYRKARHRGKRFAFYRRNGVGWLVGRGDGPHVLLDLPLVRSAVTSGKPVWLAEGEKKARTLQRLGLVATTDDVGALGFAPEHAHGLRGARQVVVVLDNDEKGCIRGYRVRRMLQDAGVREVRILLIRELVEGEGVDDWLEQRKGKSLTVKQVRSELEALADTQAICYRSG